MMHGKLSGQFPLLGPENATNALKLLHLHINGAKAATLTRPAVRV